MTTTTAQQHLTLVITHWPHLADMLTAPTTTTWPPAGLRTYLAARADDEDQAERALLRADERSPDQLGRTEAPLRVAVFDTMQDITDRLVHCATITAATIQRPPMAPAPSNWPPADRARRDALAADDAADPRRWQYTGRPRTAVDAAAWLLARVTAGRGGPFRPLTVNQTEAIASATARAAGQIEHTLDLADQSRRLTPPCPDCGAGIDLHGGAGASPLAHCTGCGRVWTETGCVQA